MFKKPYYSLNDYCRDTYGKKVYKLSLQGGLTCPNRDGKIGYRGCIFCSEGGSGDFALSIGTPATGIYSNIDSLLKDACQKHPETSYIGYFQAYTNTYGNISYLRAMYEAVLYQPSIIGISIGTRPDCINQDIINLLSLLQKKYPDKFIWIELGLQTIHEKTANYIRRGYSLSVFQDSYMKLKALHIPVIIHLILGLPGESEKLLLETIDYVNCCKPFGVKLQLLHVLRHTDLAKDYEQGLFQTLTLDAYIQLTSLCLAHLSPDIVIHRVTGDGPKQITIAPTWSFHKKNVLNKLHHYMWDNHLEQGEFYFAGTADTL